MTEELRIGGRRCLIFPPVHPYEGTKIPVLLINGDDLTFRILQKSALLPAETCYTVLILSEQRLDDYTPWPAEPLCDRFPPFGGKADDYIRWIEAELLPTLRTEVFPQAQELVIGMSGQSISALCTLYLNAKAPNLFRCAACISPSVWYPGFLEYERESVPGQQPKDWYISCGDREGVTCTDRKKNTVPYVSELIALLRENGHTVTEEHDPYDHHGNMEVRFRRAFSYLEQTLRSYL